MTSRESGLLGGFLGAVVTTVALNGLGYAVAGGLPGYDSAQGAASLYFMLGLVALPFGIVAGARLGRRLARPGPP